MGERRKIFFSNKFSLADSFPIHHFSSAPDFHVIFTPFFSR